MKREEDTFLGEYFISEIGSSIFLMSRNSDDRQFVFNVYQRFTDMSNVDGATLACYEGPVDYKAPTPRCNLTISPCQKAALKEAARTSNRF